VEDTGVAIDHLPAISAAAVTLQMLRLARTGQ
jgi:hypothetical protein